MTRLTHLRDLYDAEAPFATAYLDASRATENGGREVELRWQALRGQLAEQGAPEQALQAMEQAALAPTGEPADTTLALVANGTGLLHMSALPMRMPERATVGALPDLAPLALAMGRTAPYVLVRIDRQGADIDVVGPLGDLQQHETVDGDTFDIQKVKVGGWGHKGYQQRSENLWETNASMVADEIDRILARTGIGILAVTGDVRATEMFEKALGQRGKAALVKLESGSRAEGVSEEAIREELGRVLAAALVRDSEDPVSRFREQQGAGHGAAVSGRAAVIEALQKAQVDALLVTADLDDDSTLWIGPDGIQVAASEAELSAMGVEHGERARADAALLRAAISSDAGVVVVPGGRIDLTDGIGALLRYADASTSGA